MEQCEDMAVCVEVPAGAPSHAAVMLHWVSIKDTGHWENMYHSAPGGSYHEIYQWCYYKQTTEEKDTPSYSKVHKDKHSLRVSIPHVDFH